MNEKKWVPEEFHDCKFSTMQCNNPACKKDKNVLERANDIVQERGKSYGHPFDDFCKTAMIWSAILGIDVTPDQVAKCMIGLKLSRLSATPDHQDSIDDIVGYGWTLDEVNKKMKEIKEQLCNTDQSLTQSKPSNSR